MAMFWQCSECGGLADAVPRVSVCLECGTANSHFAADLSLSGEFSEFRDYWMHAGMAQEAPILDYEEAVHGG